MCGVWRYWWMNPSVSASDALLRPVGATVGTPAAMGVATLGAVVLLVSLRG
jgi:hypothetical protein